MNELRIFYWMVAALAPLRFARLANCWFFNKRESCAILRHMIFFWNHDRNHLYGLIINHSLSLGGCSSFFKDIILIFSWLLWKCIKLVQLLLHILQLNQQRTFFFLRHLYFSFGDLKLLSWNFISSAQVLVSHLDEDLQLFVLILYLFLQMSPCSP